MGWMSCCHSANVQKLHRVYTQSHGQCSIPLLFRNLLVKQLAPGRCPVLRTHWSGSVNSRLYTRQNYSTTNQKDYYDTLGVKPDASQSEIKTAFFKRSKEHHPDLSGKGEQEAARAMFSDIVEAYEVLGKEKSRTEYDNKKMTEPFTDSPQNWYSHNKVHAHTRAEEFMQRQASYGRQTPDDFSDDESHESGYGCRTGQGDSRPRRAGHPWEQDELHSARRHDTADSAARAERYRNTGLHGPDTSEKFLPSEPDTKTSISSYVWCGLLLLTCVYFINVYRNVTYTEKELFEKRTKVMVRSRPPEGRKDRIDPATGLELWPRQAYNKDISHGEE